MKNGTFYVEINGINHWYRVAGAEHGTTPLVIIHGGPGGTVYNFERTIGPLLEAFATIVYYEQRGCGRSAAPPTPDDYSLPILVADLEALRTTLDLPQMIPLGFSFGGELALEYTLAHPTRVHKLIVQAPSFATPDQIAHAQLRGFQQVARGALAERIAAIIGTDAPARERLNQIWDMIDTATVDRFLFHRPEAAHLNRAMWQESGLVNTGDMHQALAAHPRDAGSLSELARIHTPTLVMVGMHDRNVGVDVCRAVADQIEGTQLVIFGSSAHFPDIEEPEQYAAVVREFLAAPQGQRDSAGTGRVRCPSST